MGHWLGWGCRPPPPLCSGCCQWLSPALLLISSGTHSCVMDAFYPAHSCCCAVCLAVPEPTRTTVRALCHVSACFTTDVLRQFAASDMLFCCISLLLRQELMHTANGCLHRSWLQRCRSAGATRCSFHFTNPKPSRTAPFTVQQELQQELHVELPVVLHSANTPITLPGPCGCFQGCSHSHQCLEILPTPAPHLHVFERATMWRGN